ncbi:MAG TPA: VWA domain-containing protein [Acidobacteriota bacterium]|nr:VWA domain-containing protein [Acidobacteriota bacterium]
MKKTALLLSVIALLVGLASTQQEYKRKIPDFEKQIQVNLVLLDVVVRDRAGNYAHGLGDDDFIVLEDGKQMEIAAVDEYFLDEEAIEAARSSNRLYDSPPRNIIFILDRFFSSTYAISRGKEAIAQFVGKRLIPGDRAMIVAYDKSFKVVQDLTTDHQRLEMAAIGLQTLSASPDTPEMQMNIASDADAEFQLSSTERSNRNLANPNAIDLGHNIRMQNNIRVFLEKLELLAKSLKGLPGKKTVVLLSEGYDGRLIQNAAFSVYRNPMEAAEGADNAAALTGDVSGRFQTSSINSIFHDTVSRINDANTSFYVVDLSTFAGERSRADQFVYQSMTQRVEYDSARLDSLGSLAAASGGKLYSGINELDRVLDAINTDTGNYYIVAYHTANTKTDGKFRTVSIKTRSDDYRVRSREGYFEPKRFEKMDGFERYVHLMEGFFRSSPVNELQAASSVFFLPINAGEAVGSVAVEIPADRLGEKGDLSLEIIGTVSDRAYARNDAFHKKYEYGGILESIREDGSFTVKLPMLFRAGYNRLRVIARDNATGKRYHLFGDYTVHGLKRDDLYMSSVALFDEVVKASTVEKYNLQEIDLGKETGHTGYRSADPLRATTGRPLFPRLDHGFTRDEQPVIFFSTGNFWQDEKTGEVDFFIDYNALDSTGREIVLPVVKEKLFPVPGTNRMNVLSQLQLSSLEPGDYQLRVRFLDKHNTQGVQRFVHLTIR